MIHIRKRHIVVCLLAALLLSVTVASADIGTVTASYLYLREDATSDSDALTKLREGTEVDILDKDGHWYKVSYGQYEGYVYDAYITVSEDDDLQKGDSGTAVKKVQERLKELGYYSATCDGDFGNVTVKAVKAFQEKNGLSETGVVDEKTQKKLDSSSAIKADGTKASASSSSTSSSTTAKDDGILRKGDKGDAVKKLQQRLKDLGYYTYSCDSSYGDRTVEAVKAFQKKNGLTQDGVAGTVTQKKLYADSAIAADGKTVEADKEEDKDTTTLKKGDEGDAVKKLQKRLKELGYYTPSVADGEYGTKTVEAVKAFQKKNGLSQDGIAGPATQKKLYADSAIAANGKTEEADKEDDKDTTTLQKGDEGDAVKKLQKRLKELGYYTPTVADGEYGSKTVEAVKAFQKKNGLTQDGVAGPTTQAKLYADSAIAANGKTEADDKEEDKDTTTLQTGDKGDAVKKLQQRLKELGYYIYGIDSSYGNRTVEAVKSFQKKNGLNQDGIAGATTQAKLYSESAIGANDKTDDAEDEDATLRKGDEGDAVKKLQRRLMELGYYTLSVADGDYGSKTVEAVKAFQKKNGLTQDGVAGPATQAKLYSESAIAAKDKVEEDKDEEDTATLSKGDKGDAVKKLQQRLKDLGYYKYGIDSSYGDRTVEAVKAFQKNNNLTVDGVAGPTTQTKLYSSSAVGATGSSNSTLATNQTLAQGDAGTQVKLLQERLKELGYYNTTIDSDYGYRTAEAVSDFQRANGLNVTGKADSTTLKKLVSSSALSKEDAEKAEENEKKYVTEQLDWFKDGESTFPKKAIIKVKDCKTGLIFNAKVLYGTNHLDVEPLTASDTATLLKINGGVEFSYKRRPVLVQYDGHVYAASIYSEPHGDQTITDNNFDGQFCLHFYGSKLHKKDENGVQVVDSDHQKCVNEAMKYTW